MSAKTWDKPVHEGKHTELTAAGWTFVESRWEGEFAVSKYRKGKNVTRVNESGNVRSGEK